jgi:NADP-dependent aldehyde dehydrogenase
VAAVPVWSVDPRTGKQRERVAAEATPADVDATVRAAYAARERLAADRETRLALLRAAADQLEADGERIVRTADAETALGDGRLTGELGRATGQLRAFADEVSDGAYLGVIIDHADEAAAPPRPDLRRCKIPLGVVAVYAASNFPLAFSVPGGDTASALAAGCPVVIKAHPDHPATSELCAAALHRAALQVGLSADTISIVHGFEAGVELVRHPLVSAAGFTGSIRGGRALFDAAAARPVPIPFHGELGSLNPVVVTEDAARERAGQIGAGLAKSVVLGKGQFCVKPGLVLAPMGAAGDELVETLAERLGAADPGVLLDTRMRNAFIAGVRDRSELDGVRVPVAAGESDQNTVAPGFLTVPAKHLTEEGSHELLLEECFGPVTVVARYADTAEVSAVLSRLPGNLTATVQLGADETAGDDGRAARLLAELTPLAGRVVVNGWPTGVAVSPAQHHGGPYVLAVERALHREHIGEMAGEQPGHAFTRTAIGRSQCRHASPVAVRRQPADCP